MKRIILMLFIAPSLLISSCNTSSNKVSDADPKALQNMSAANLKAVGLKPESIEALIDSIEAGYYPNRHSLLIFKNQKLVVENYFSGNDALWGDDLGVVDFTDSTLHDMRSVSKSVVSAAIGIAIDQGLLKDVDQNIFDFFPEYQHFRNEGREALTLKHFLTMTSGLQWNEEVPYDNPENSEIQMINSDDGIAFVLSRKLTAAPGTVWQYNGGTTEVLAATVQRVSGMNIHDFTKKYLFQPLNITKTGWTISPSTNMPSGASGLRLLPKDMVKFGRLYLNDGKWEGKQVIPAQWVDDSLHPWVSRPDGGAYGYQFWIFDYTIGAKQFSIPAAVGNGDQRIFIDRTNDLLVVTTAGNYDKWNIPKNASVMLKEILTATVNE
jgi:CubicO group peptidase (beta-lactamase class C family)